MKKYVNRMSDHLTEVIFSKPIPTGSMRDFLIVTTLKEEMYKCAVPNEYWGRVYTVTCEKIRNQLENY